MRWEKVACWSTKAAISLKRVGLKIEQKLLWRAHRKSPTLFRMITSPAPYGLLFPKIGGSQPLPKHQSPLSQERVKLYGLQIWPVHSQGPFEQQPIKISEKKERGHIQGLPNFFWITPIISGAGKATNLRTFIGSIGTKPIKKFGKSSRGRTQGLSKFSGHTYIGRIARSSWQ